MGLRGVREGVLEAFGEVRVVCWRSLVILAVSCDDDALGSGCRFRFVFEPGFGGVRVMTELEGFEGMISWGCGGVLGWA